MSALQTIGADDAGYKVDVRRGDRVGRVSSEWYRPADERYLLLTELFDAVRSRADRTRSRVVESAAIRVEASSDDPERLEMVMPGAAFGSGADPLELRAARRLGGSARRLPAPASSGARRHQSAIRPE